MYAVIDISRGVSRGECMQLYISQGDVCFLIGETGANYDIFKL